MGYIENNLLPEEEVVVEAEHHVIALLWPAVIVVAGIALAQTDSLYWLAPILLLVGLWKEVNVIIAFATNEMGLTDQRIVGKTGFISRNTLEVRNDFISGLSVDQSIPGRILGYGTIVVNGEGDESVGFPYIRDPQGLRNTIQSHLAEAA